MTPEVACMFDEATNTASYVVSADGEAAIVDPVLDFDPVSGRTRTASAERLLDHVREAGLRISWILETHAHADHMTAAAILKEKTGAKTAIGSGVTRVQEMLAELFDDEDMAVDGSQFDALFDDGATFPLGPIECRVMATPGHTPACATYVVGNACFVGDTLFMPDSGTARCDFPGGDASLLYESIRRIFELPGETRMFVGHDYGAGGARGFAWETTVAAQRDRNVHVGGGALEHDYVQMRRARDASLPLPRLFFPSVQVNMRAGAFPPPGKNGVSYVRIPLNQAMNGEAAE